MAKLKLGPIADDKPVKVTLEPLANRARNHLSADRKPFRQTEPLLEARQQIAACAKFTLRTFSKPLAVAPLRINLCGRAMTVEHDDA
jgi:hypothetical protein